MAVEFIRGAHTTTGMIADGKPIWNCWNSNAFLLEKGGVLYIIDSGSGRTFGEKLWRQIEAHKDARKVYLIMTHAHVDHVGNGALVEHVKETFPEAHYYIHGAAQRVLAASDGFHLRNEPLSPYFGEVETGYAEAEFLQEAESKEYRFGEVSFGGWEVGEALVLATPGHSPDSVVVYFRQGRALLAGDLLWFVNPNMTHGDIGRFLDSLAKVKSLVNQGRIDYLGWGHGEPLEGKDAILSYISALEEKEWGLLRAVESLLSAQEEWTVEEYMERLREVEQPAVEEAFRINWPYWPSFLDNYLKVFLRSQGYKEYQESRGRVWRKV